MRRGFVERPATRHVDDFEVTVASAHGIESDARAAQPQHHESRVLALALDAQIHVLDDHAVRQRDRRALEAMEHDVPLPIDLGQAGRQRLFDPGLREWNLLRQRIDRPPQGHR
ncbi:hypothetical protein WJ47_03750 [Burkholderia ubonensis]|uniref:Uncharacterized protein n=1 Tax=Burkholderia ubonensis TaxID=101571 RepID=A0AB73G5E2_9BURK|nr:hypothetical protein WJ47_03750 [Burkholderia ubonensis]KVM35505.1 hypothetical protein WJ53_31865 [Burkholderia ubonensis]